MNTRRRILFAFALAILLGGVLFGSGLQASARQPYMLVYYDGHMHTVRSDGSGSVADIKATAMSRGLNIVVITDHCSGLTREEWASLVAETAAASDTNFLALPGFEITGDDGIFNRTHMNALNVADPFVGADSLELCPEEVWPSPDNPDGTGALYPENVTKWAEYIHSQGGIAIHNHPSGTTRLDYEVDNLEVYNQSHVDDVSSYAAALGYPPQQAWQLGLTFNDFALYGERDANMLVPFPGFATPVPLRYALWYATQNYIPPYVGQWLGAPEAPLSSWDQLLMAYVNGDVDHPIFAVANSDAHNTGDPDSTVGMAKNGIYLKRLTAPEFYKALKAGRNFATTGPSLNLDVNGALMGETTKLFPGSAKANIRLSASSESQTAILAQIDIYKNGIVWQTLNPLAPTFDQTLTDMNVTENGYYRIEITSLDPATGNYYFAWSNPVFILARQPD